MRFNKKVIQLQRVNMPSSFIWTFFFLVYCLTGDHHLSIGTFLTSLLSHMAEHCVIENDQFNCTFSKFGITMNGKLKFQSGITLKGQPLLLCTHTFNMSSFPLDTQLTATEHGLNYSSNHIRVIAQRIHFTSNSVLQIIKITWRS